MHLMTKYFGQIDYDPTEVLSFPNGISSSQDLCYYVLCVVREPVGESTVNLKCPIVIHAEEKKAVQVILDTGTYHMRHRLSEFRSEEAGSVC